MAYLKQNRPDDAVRTAWLRALCDRT